jgi:N-acetylglucosamine malate deacetylase 2
MMYSAPKTARESIAHSAELLDRLCGEREMPRVLMIVAHPDDEVIGAGVRLSWLGKDITIVHVTDGAPADSRDARAAGFSSAEGYAAARRGELLEAMSLVRVSAGQLVQLGFDDQSVVHHITEIADAIVALIHEHEPEIVLTHPYEGGHPDHDAVALAIRLAIEGRARCPQRAEDSHNAWLQARRGEDAAPYHLGNGLAVLEMSSYHLGTEGLRSANFLPPNMPTRFLQLTRAERAWKQKRFACFRTQQHVLRWFRTDVEAFRVAPEYDFTQRPHPGILFYEQFKIGMTWSEWHAHADAALQQLSIA